MVPALMAQNDAPSARVRGFNNQLLTVYGRLFSSPARDAMALRSQFAGMIRQRQALLGELIEKNPAQALSFAFSQDVLANMSAAFPESASKLESEGAWEGELEYVILDSPDLTSHRAVYRMKVGNETYDIHFAKEEPVGLKCRDRLRVRGVRVGSHVAAADGNIQSVAPAGVCNPIGAQKSAVLLVTFPGVPAPAITPASVYDIFFKTSGRSVSEFWREASYGVTTTTGDVYGWYTLDAVYTCDQYSAMRAAAIRAADPDVNFTQYNRIFIIFPGGGCSWAGLGTLGCESLSSADGGFTASTAWMVSDYFLPAYYPYDYGVKLATHEGGHNLGLHHASSRAFVNEALGASGTVGTLNEYGDVFSTMGSWNLGHYSAPHKKMLNWMAEGGTIQTVQSSGSFSVQPFELNAATVQALKIKRGTSGDDWVWLEYRQPLGNYDSTLSSQVFSGATIHYEDLTTGSHSHLLDYTPESSSWTDPALAAGATWIDPYTSLRIAITGATSSALNVNVTYGATPCVTANPTVTLSPANPNVYAGNDVDYTVSLSNNDSSGCSPRTFDLNSTIPSSWPTSFSQTVLTVSASSSASATMRKSVPASTTPATYAVNSSAQSSTNTGTANANVTVMPPVQPLTVTLTLPKTSYSSNSQVAITATVLQGSVPVSGASVTFTLTRPDGTSTRAASTGSNGQAIWYFKVKPRGTYQVTAQAASGSQTASAAAKSFTVQ